MIPHLHTLKDPSWMILFGNSSPGKQHRIRIFHNLLDLCPFCSRHDLPPSETPPFLPHLQAADGLQMRSLVAEDQRRVRLRVAYAGNPMGLQHR